MNHLSFAHGGNYALRWRFLLFFSVFACVSANVFAQQRHTISGYISDGESGEKLVSANLFDAKSQKGALTNTYGFYSLTLPAGEVQLVFSSGGFQAKQMAFMLTRDTVLNVDLRYLTTGEVEIVAEETRNIQEQSQMSVVEIPIQQIKRIPMMFGEVDVLKALQLMPGVGKGSEGTAGLYVRGGGPDQNLILLDGVPLYYVSHLGGFFSVFNADALSSTKLYKGGFPAQFGGRLSSVLDIRMKEGNAKKFGGSGTIGLVSSKLSLEGPLKFGQKGQTTFVVSGRRTLLDLFTRPAIALAARLQTDGATRANGGYHFYDFNAKVNHTFSDRDRLYLSTYWGDDKLTVGIRERSQVGDTITDAEFGTKLAWGNRLAALRWNHVYSPRLFSNVTATYVQYYFNTGLEFNELKYATNKTGQKDTTSSFDILYNSGVRDWGAKVDFDFYPTPNHSIKFGANYIYHTYSPGVTTVSYSFDQDRTTNKTGNDLVFSHEGYVYVEDDFKIGSRFSANAGAHLAGYYVNEEFFPSVQPRFSGRFLLTDKVSVKASYAKMTQFMHLLTNNTASFPTDLWVPATGKTPPQQSWQAAAGVATSLWKDQLELSVEGYYKQMDGLIEYKEGTSSSFTGDNQAWEDKIVRAGKGEAYGLEVLLQKKAGKTTGWIGYTLSWNHRQFDSLNGGQRFFYRYDRRHDVSVVVTHDLNEKWTLSAVWVYGSGNAVTLGTGRYNDLYSDMAAAINNGTGYFFGNGTSIESYGKGRNSFRMPVYHRLDVSAVKHVKHHIFKREYEAEWCFGAYNAYSRQNPFFLYYGNKDQTYLNPADQEKVLKQFALFPIIPSVAYNFKF